VLAEQGRVDVLVNNAGYGSYGAVEEVPLDEGRRQFEVNLFGLARMSQLVIPSMRSAGSGRILNVSSIGGHFGEALGAWYHASKFAVEGFSDSLRLELHGFGIHVVVIEPGAIRTEWGDGALESARRYSGSGAYAGQVEAMAALYAQADQRGAEPMVIAATILEAVEARRPKSSLRHPVLRQGNHRSHQPRPRPPPRRRSYARCCPASPADVPAPPSLPSPGNRSLATASGTRKPSQLTGFHSGVGPQAAFHRNQTGRSIERRVRTLRT
jgi:short-subunit dehydrogenase